MVLSQGSVIAYRSVSIAVRGSMRNKFSCHFGYAEFMEQQALRILCQESIRQDEDFRVA